MIKVMIVEDTQFMRTMLRLLFEKHDDIVVAGEADTGEKAIHLYQKLKPDVVTMDITMPNMGGVEAVKNIIKLDPKAQICMVTAMGQETFVKQSIIAGAKNFIVKPFKEEKVITVIRTLADAKKK